MGHIPNAERTPNKNAASGYAPLGSDSLVPAANAPAKAVYATGGGQALAPGDIGAEASANKGAASGYASLDANGDVPVGQLDLALLPPTTFSDQSAIGFDVARQPSTTRPVLVTVSATVLANKSEEGKVELMVENVADPGVSRGIVAYAKSATNDAVNTQDVGAGGGKTVIVPAGWRYKVKTTNVAGTCTFGDLNIMEQTL